ncbi:DNA repair protein RecO [Candidatus Woesebacteria bacterium]|nr:DNA repair protein RecO [Candidatus Woesebacteria bacterium]
MASRTFTITGIVIKRSNTGETDRIVTLLSQEFGKIVCVAKGVRSLHSSKRASLEPGNIVRAFCVANHSLPIITQATLLSDTADSRESLKMMRQISQFLEIIDALFVEEEIEESFFTQIITLRNLIVVGGATVTDIRSGFEEILVQLGYHDPIERLESIIEKVSEVSQRHIHSYEYLVVKPH